MRRGSCELCGARPEGGEVAGSHDKSDLFNDGCLPVLNAVLWCSCAHTMPLLMYDDPARDALTSEAESMKALKRLLTSLTFGHDRRERVAMLAATWRRRGGLRQSEIWGPMRGRERGKWSFGTMLCPRVRRRGSGCFLVPWQSEFRASWLATSGRLRSHHRFVASSLSRNGRW